MMIIAVFNHKKHPNSKELFLKIKNFFHERNVTVVTEASDAKEFNLPSLDSVKDKKIDFMITLGGDGTILKLAHEFFDFNVPILGINLGHLGFMADVPIDDLYPSLTDLLDKKYSIENRIVLEGVSLKGEKFFAINDFVFHRAKNPSLIKLSIDLDDLYLNTFEADGVIVATPNGSTAYSLAAGGPILSAGLDGFVLTPICAHTISNRPIVLTSSHKIKVSYLSNYDPIEVIADGCCATELCFGDSFYLQKSNRVFKLVNLTRRDYFSTLRTKLGWSGKLR
jgi:NAD+ kinase